MLSSQLLKLEKILSHEQIDRIESYITSFSTNTKLTASKFAMDMQFDIAQARKVLDVLVDLGVFRFSFIVRCPSCGLLLEPVEDITDIESQITCYGCDVESDISTDDVEVIYTLKEVPFVEGQQSYQIERSETSVVLNEDSLTAFLELHDYNSNLVFYNPTQSEEDVLIEKYNDIFSKHKTTTAKGKTLEDLVATLFNTCKHFRATTGMRLQPNQIDCYVRNKLFAPGVPGLTGIDSFMIECKNEKRPPTATYFNKLHSVLRVAGKHFGIIVSKASAPSTFVKLANQIFLRDDIVIISIDKDDLENIIVNKNNLLECIGRKVSEVTVNATKDLVELGLYDC